MNVYIVKYNNDDFNDSLARTSESYFNSITDAEEYLKSNEFEKDDSEGFERITKHGKYYTREYAEIAKLGKYRK